jgi:hypothetical protein
MAVLDTREQSSLHRGLRFRDKEKDRADDWVVPSMRLIVLVHLLSPNYEALLQYVINIAGDIHEERNCRYIKTSFEDEESCRFLPSTQKRFMIALSS